MILYHITEATVKNILRDVKGNYGKQEIIKEVTGHKYPIKIVFDIQRDFITIITVYQLKRGLQ